MTAATTVATRPTVASQRLDARPWAFTSGVFDALGHRFAVRTTDAALGRYLRGAFASLAAPHTPLTTYSLVDDAPGDRRFALYADHQQLMTTSEPSLALATLVWHINRRAVAGNRHRVLLHAAAAERGGLGVVLAGRMEAGKTTLVAGLVRRGFRYVTDEVVAIEPGSGLICPYPKPLSIDPGSFDVLSDLRPDTEPPVTPYLARQWQVDASSIRPDAVAGPIRPGIAIVTRYVEGAATRLQPVCRREMLLELIEQTFDLHADGARNLTMLARTVSDARCFRLQVGDLEAACRLVERIVHQEEPGGAR